MVSLKLNKAKLLQDLQEKDDPQLYLRLAMMGVEVDSVTEQEVIVDITPNRPDLLSQQGFTRAALAFFGKKPGLREYPTTKSNLKVKVDDSLREIRPYTACAVVRNLNLDDEALREIIEIQEKLHVTFCRNRKKAAIGIYPMEHIAGTITFKALPPQEIVFKPLEAKKEMDATQILEEHPKGKEFAHLLEDLKEYPVFVDSKKNVLSMPPIINSEYAGKVTQKTKEVFIESSGSDFRTCHQVVQMICAALADMGATIHTVEVIYSRKTQVTPDMSTQEQEFYLYYINRRLGIKLTQDELPTLLAKMGLGVRSGRIKDTFYALLPAYRTDFLHQIDVVEDLAIAYGYENIHAELPKVATIASESPMTVFQDVVREVLVGRRLLEAKNYHLIGQQFQEQLELKDVVLLKSSVSEGYDSLRRDLLGGLLLTLQRNRMHEYPQELFEIGTVFSNDNGVREQALLAAIFAGERDYTDVRQMVDALLHALKLSPTYEVHADPRFMHGRCARVLVQEKMVGVLGEISPAALTHAGVHVPAAACEIDLDVLLALR